MSETRSTGSWVTRWIIIAVVAVIVLKFVGLGIVLAAVVGFFAGLVLSRPG